MDAARVRNRVHRAFGLVAVVAVLAGCSGGSGTEQAAPTQASSAASSPAASASPSSTLTAAEQRAFEEATAVVLAYRQTIADLYSGARTDLNDLDKVATGDLLDRGLQNIQQGLSQGYRSEPLGVELELVSAEPVSISMNKEPPTIVVRACIDATGLTDVAPDGSRTRGARELSDYHLAMADYLPRPSWAVTRETAERSPEDRRC